MADESKRTQKQAFRSAALKRLKALRRATAYRKDKTVQKRLIGLLRRLKPGSAVMLYAPLPMEADIRPVARWLRRRRIRVYLPFMEGESFRLVQCRLPLRKKRFGILEPKKSTQYRRKRIDMALVPVVGIDATGRRIGFGRGMYDRFFELESRNISRTIFVSRELCYAPRILTDERDVSPDLIVAGGSWTYASQRMHEARVRRS